MIVNVLRQNHQNEKVLLLSNKSNTYEIYCRFYKIGYNCSHENETTQSIMDEEQSDKTYHVGDTINFIGADGKTKVGIISAKPTFGKFEVKPKKDNGQRIHVDYHKIIDKV